MMIYILVALKAEAQAFVDKFKLKNYKNEKMEVVISGIGSQKIYLASSIVVKKMKKDDLILNIGICGASTKYEIGELLDARKTTITSIDYEAKDDKYDVVDMESAGFIDATKDIENSFIFKIVSDHFEPKSVTKDKAKKLIFNQIDEIMKKVGVCVS